MGDLDETERIWVLSKKSAQKINHIEIILQEGQSMEVTK